MRVGNVMKANTITMLRALHELLNSDCDPGYTKAGDWCLMVVTEPANFLEAILDCKSRDASLASIHSQEEQDNIHGLTLPTRTWIGLTDFLDEGQFSWVDGSKVTFTNWMNGEPNNKNNNQHCTLIRRDGKWKDAYCKKEKPYVCQKPFIEVTITPVKKDSECRGNNK